MADNKVYEIKESAIADPGSLGLACFALTTFCLSMVNAGLVVKESVVRYKYLQVCGNLRKITYLEPLLFPLTALSGWPLAYLNCLALRK